MKNFLKKNKFTVFALVFLVLLFILIICAKELFFPNVGSAIYGDRLNGIVEVKKEDKETIVNSLKENENVVEAKSSVTGKTLEVFITVKDEVSLGDAKKIGSSILEKVSDEIKKDYDIQVYISKNSKEQNNFPIIGNKHVKNEGFSWTKDREIVTSIESSEGEE